VDQFVPGYEASIWEGIGAPRNTPREIIDNLNKEINAGLADSTMRVRLADLGVNALPSHEAGDVAARARQAVDEAGGDRIGNDYGPRYEYEPGHL
jgi:tripartite-type tricarboxylate transporter receptor subunit TctC